MHLIAPDMTTYICWTAAHCYMRLCVKPLLFLFILCEVHNISKPLNECSPAWTFFACAVNGPVCEFQLSCRPHSFGYQYNAPGKPWYHLLCSPCHPFVAQWGVGWFARNVPHSNLSLLATFLAMLATRKYQYTISQFIKMFSHCFHSDHTHKPALLRIRMLTLFSPRRLTLGLSNRSNS